MRFFEDLDDRFCPLDPSLATSDCTHTFGNSISILHANKMGSEDIDDVLAVLRFKWGCCDREVLYNVAESNRLKAKYWHGNPQQRSSELDDSFCRCS